MLIENQDDGQELETSQDDTELEAQTDDTDQETSSDDTDGDTSDDNPELAILREKFGERFSSFDELADNFAEKERTLTQAQQERAASDKEADKFRAMVMDMVHPKEVKPPMDDERFIENFNERPLDAIGEGFVRREEHARTDQTIEELQTQLTRMTFAENIADLDPESDLAAAAQYIRSNARNPEGAIPPPGVSKAWDALTKHIPLGSPTWNDPSSLKLAYRGLKAQEAPTKPMTVVPEGKKTKAKTAPSRPTRSESELDVDTMKNMSADELKAYVIKHRPKIYKARD